MTGEFDGVRFVASWVDDFEAEFGAGRVVDELSAGVGSFAGGGLIVDFLNEKTSGEAGVERGSLGEDFGNQEHFGLFIDV